MIKPHNQAGYSGGGKSLIPGVAGLETILENHSYRYVSDFSSRIGIIRSNPIREDIEEVASLIGPCFILNAVLNPDKSLAAIVAGDIILAHRKGVEILDSFSRVRINGKADIVIAGCAYPVGIDFYQTLNAITSPIRLANPVIKDNGTIIVASECPEGIGHKSFFELASHFKSPEDFLNELSSSASFKDEQYAVQIWAEVLCKAKVIVVTKGISKEDLNRIHAMHADSLDEAMEMVNLKPDEEARILVLPNAPYTICSLRE
jgi:nickel-dependent lactate racemase